MGADRLCWCGVLRAGCLLVASQGERRFAVPLPFRCLNTLARKFGDVFGRWTTLALGGLRAPVRRQDRGLLVVRSARVAGDDEHERSRLEAVVRLRSPIVLLLGGVGGCRSPTGQLL